MWFYTIFSLLLGQRAGISSKLDFGSDSGSVGVVSGLKGTNGFAALSQRSNVIKLDEQPSLDGIGVVCVSGTCNSTKTTTIDSKEGVLTDVTVHVQTKVDLSAKNDSAKKTEDTSDVPIVVGYGGSNKPSTQSVQTINTSGPLPINPPFNTGSSILDGPTISTSGVGNRPLFGSSHIADTPVVVNLEDAFPETRRRIDSNPVYVATPNTFVGFNSGRPSSRPHYVDPKDENVRYDTNNAIEVPLPYLGPSFNSHYFGESPPPQLLWHPKGRPVYNPLEFKEVYRTSWSTPTWQSRSYQPNSIGNGRPLYQEFTTHVTPDGKICSCQSENHHQPNPALRWYPTAALRTGKSHKISYNHQAHIDDKLAPLN